MKSKDNSKKILFITWDNAESTYLEGLFVPIFSGLKRQFGYEFHVIQFSWADPARVEFLKHCCTVNGVRYQHIPVSLKPVAAIGKYVSLLRGIRSVEKYIAANDIGVVMPRSTMPARIGLAVKKSMPSIKLIFDADGLPIEERVDFANLKEGSIKYRQLKNIEREVTKNAEVILTRSRLAVNYLAQQYDLPIEKFFVVTNGRDEQFFQDPGAAIKQKTKEELGISLNSKVIVYSGSLGPQYGIEQMLYIFRELVKSDARWVFLVLTNRPEYLKDRLQPTDLNVLIKRVDFADVPKYLSLAEVGFAIRKASPSMQGVAPIKIGEYMLMGLPVVASSRIGDTDSLLAGKSFAFILDDYFEINLDKAVHWVLNESSNHTRANEVRDLGMDQFGLNRSINSYQMALQALFL